MSIYRVFNFNFVIMSLVDFLRNILNCDIDAEIMEKLTPISSQLKNQLEGLFEMPILQLDYTSDDNWHLGIKPKSLAYLSADEGRQVVLNIVKKYIPNFVLGLDKIDPEYELSIHIPKIPPFVPKQLDKGVHITIGMNDEYLVKLGQTSNNHCKLKEGVVELLKEEIYLNEDAFKNLFKIEKFSFFHATEGNMDCCNGRTIFSAVLVSESATIIDNFRAKYLMANSGRHAKITCAYLSLKHKLNRCWNHNLWNGYYCPMLSQSQILESVYKNPAQKTTEPQPFLVFGLFKQIKTLEQGEQLKNILKDL